MENYFSAARDLHAEYFIQHRAGMTEASVEHIAETLRRSLAPTVSDATGLREGPCLELAKELYRTGQTGLPPGLKL